MRKHALYFALPIALAFVSCSKIDMDKKDGTFAYGHLCDQKTIMAYSDWEHLRNEHKFLYNNFISGQEEESVLESFESSKTHYSLRKKDNEMDDGIIPDDPNFETFDYTTDEILEAILNQDGMVIVGGELYIWDDGCVIYKTKFSCKNYQVLLDFRDKLKAHALNPSVNLKEDIAKLRTQYKISEINKCIDARYDLETISEDNLEFNSDTIPYVNSRSSGCGYNAFIYSEILSNNSTTKKARLKLSANTIQVAGANPTFAFYLPNITANNQVKIITGSIPNFVTNADWYTGLSSDDQGIVYPGEWMEIEVDYALINQLQVKLRSVVYPFSGNSCLSEDNITINLNCLIFISKKPLNALNGTWQFDIQGLTVLPTQQVIWDFGDGSSHQVVVGQTSVVYSYTVPCAEEDYTVIATIEGYTGCGNPFTVDNVLVGDPCKRDKWRKVDTFKLSGKNAKLVIKIRDKYFNGGTASILKNKFRWRVSGEKSIETSGTVFKTVGSNCLPEDLSAAFGTQPVKKNAKGRLVQKLDNGTHYAFDVNLPYTVTFKHTDGSFGSRQVMFAIPCSN